MNQAEWNKFFQEAHYIGSLSKKEQVKYHLITKYKNKVSKRLKREQETLLEKGKKEFSVILGHIVNRPNPFMKWIKSGR